MKDTPGKPVPVTGSNLDEKIKNAKTQLDAQVREVVRWHFSPDTGTPFWQRSEALVVGGGFADGEDSVAAVLL